MAKALYDGVSGVARKVKKKYDGVSGVARKVKKAYDGVSGVARQYWSTGTPLSSLAVGSTVYMKVDGVSTAFLVVNQGRPSSAYDSSCDGTWLLMKDCYESRVWDSSNNDYRNSDVHSYLNNTFVNLFDSDIKSVIKQVTIPYTKGTGSSGSLAKGTNGLSAKIFLISYYEAGFAGIDPNVNAEGMALDYFYFDDASDPKLVANLNGSAVYWWLRSPNTNNTTTAWRVGSRGGVTAKSVTTSGGIRPCLILPSTQTVDESFNIVA